MSDAVIVPDDAALREVLIAGDPRGYFSYDELLHIRHLVEQETLSISNTILTPVNEHGDEILGTGDREELYAFLNKYREQIIKNMDTMRVLDFLLDTS